jgi:hypothetical protein
LEVDYKVDDDRSPPGVVPERGSARARPARVLPSAPASKASGAAGVRLRSCCPNFAHQQSKVEVNAKFLWKSFQHSKHLSVCIGKTPKPNIELLRCFANQKALEQLSS